MFPRGLAGRTLPVLVLAALFMGGCAQEPLPLPPTVSLSDVERLSSGHIFSDRPGLLAQPGPAQLHGFSVIPAPEPLTGREFLVGVTPMDISRIHAGLRGRSEASLEIFASNVRQQQEGVLRMALRLLESEKEPVLEMELAELEDQFYRTVSEVRSDAALQRRQLLMEIGVLQSQNRVLSTLHGTPDDMALEQKQAELQALDNRIEQQLRQQRHQIDREKQTLRDEYRLRQEAEVERQRLLASAESTRRIEMRSRESRQAVSQFLDAVTGLRRASDSMDGVLAPVTAPVAFELPMDRCSVEFASVERQVSQSVRKDTTLASRLASGLTPKNDEPGMAEERLRGLLQPMPGL